MNYQFNDKEHTFNRDLCEVRSTYEVNVEIDRSGENFHDLPERSIVICCYCHDYIRYEEMLRSIDHSIEIYDQLGNTDIFTVT